MIRLHNYIQFMLTQTHTYLRERHNVISTYKVHSYAYNHPIVSHTHESRKKNTKKLPPSPVHTTAPHTPLYIYKF